MAKIGSLYGASPYGTQTGQTVSALPYGAQIPGNVTVQSIQGKGDTGLPQNKPAMPMMPPAAPPTEYGPPPVYKPNLDFGTLPNYNFAPDKKYLNAMAAHFNMIASQANANAAREAAEQRRQRELVQSQYQRPRQSHITLLGGY